MLQGYRHLDIGLQTQIQQLMDELGVVVQLVEDRIPKNEMSDVERALGVWHIYVHTPLQDLMKVVDVFDSAPDEAALRDVLWQPEALHLVFIEMSAQPGHGIMGDVRIETEDRGNENHAEVWPDAVLPILGHSCSGQNASQMRNKHGLGRVELLVQVCVRDDVVGWHPDPFRGTAEFYQDFARYELELEVPVGYAVQATGRLANPESVWAPTVLARWRAAEAGDTPVVVVPVGERGRATRTTGDGWLRWRFLADSVRDVAFVATRASVWEAVRTAVGDRDGDGRPDSTLVVVIYRPGAFRWRQALAYARHAIAYLSSYTGLPYPWPHITAVEGGGIVGGGMEYPMMTLIGDYTAAPPLALYAVVAHELGHMWIPMVVATDERRYGWMDEGSTTFHENEARNAFAPQAGDAHASDRETYLRAARLGREGEILRWSDFHYDLGRYIVASYPKPAMLLRLLQGWLGPDRFAQIWQGFLRAWAYRHPYPWDFFAYVEAGAGRNLGWFWRAWYAETWTLDQALGAVDVAPDGAVRVTVRDRRDVPMPAIVRLTRANGAVETREVPVETWLRGRRTAVVSFGPGAAPVRVELDPNGLLPDLDRSNNVWTPR